MSHATTGTSLPASITDGAAWAAFDYVQDLPWTLRFETSCPLMLDVDHGFDFQSCLDSAGASDFQKQARGYVAMRILEIAASYDERRLKMLGVSADRVRCCAASRSKALATLRDTVITRIRSDLTKLLDGRPSAWAGRLKVQVALLPDEQGLQVAQYAGLDQERNAGEIRAGLNYIFQTLEPEILRQEDGLVLSGHERKLREARAARRDTDPKAQGRNLVVRAFEARLASAASGGVSGNLTSLRSTLEDELRERVETNGCWGLIDATIERDRAAENLRLPEILPAEIWDLLRQQQRRLSAGEA